MKRTEKGELSVYVSTWTMLTKSLLPLPDKFHGLTDIDTRYRNRHLDMIVNDEVILTLKKRALIIQTIRRFIFIYIIFLFIFSFYFIIFYFLVILMI